MRARYLHDEIKKEQLKAELAQEEGNVIAENEYLKTLVSYLRFAKKYMKEAK